MSTGLVRVLSTGRYMRDEGCRGLMGGKRTSEGWTGDVCKLKHQGPDLLDSYLVTVEVSSTFYTYKVKESTTKL